METGSPRHGKADRVSAGPLTCLSCRERAAHLRGVCDRCYTRHRIAVARGLTTWADLERQGLVLPAQQQGRAWRKFTLRSAGKEK
jgi:hypothetical protein